MHLPPISRGASSPLKEDSTPSNSILYGRLALHMNVTRLYANTFCEYAPPTIATLRSIFLLVAMLNGRSHLRDKSSGVFMSNFNSSSHNRGPSASHHPGESINLDHRLAFNRSVSQIHFSAIMSYLYADLRLVAWHRARLGPVGIGEESTYPAPSGDQDSCSV